MRTTYLAIFGASPSTITGLKKLLSEGQTPEEREELNKIATEALTNPEKVSPEDFEKIFADDGKTRAKNIFEKKLEPLVDKFLQDNPDKEDIAWGVFEVMTSEDFFAQLNPDEMLDFNVRYHIDLHPEGILLPNGEWSQDEPKEAMTEHKDGHIFVFFSIDT